MMALYNERKGMRTAMNNKTIAIIVSVMLLFAAFAGIFAGIREEFDEDRK